MLVQAIKTCARKKKMYPKNKKANTIYGARMLKNESLDIRMIDVTNNSSYVFIHISRGRGTLPETGYGPT